MSSFDFTALVTFLQALFDMFAALLEKLGFSFGDKPAEGENTEEGDDNAEA